MKFLRLKAVLNLVPYSRSAIYRKVANGEFPKPIKLGARAIAWVESDVQRWMAERAL